MKLVDILAQELKVWPEDCKAITQDSDGYVASAKDCDVDRLRFDHNAWSGEGGNYMVIHKLAEDHKTAIITRAEWQAAVDALNAPKVVEWDGVGDPPAMSKIEYKSVEGTWKKGVFVGRVYGKIVAGCDETKSVGWLPSDEMRPIRTDEQVAAEDREKAVNLMLDATNIRAGIISDRRAMARQLYDAGYRKEQKPCGS